MSIDANTNLSSTSISVSRERYSPSGGKGFAEAYSNLSFQLTGVMVAATFMTSASTLPLQPISVGSAASTDLGIHSFRKTKRSSQVAIATFSTELQRRSKSLSREDAQLLREIILSKSQPGIPRF